VQECAIAPLEPDVERQRHPRTNDLLHIGAVFLEALPPENLGQPEAGDVAAEAPEKSGARQARAKIAAIVQRLVDPQIAQDSAQLTTLRIWISSLPSVMR
jgi:hypothetical protein